MQLLINLGVEIIFQPDWLIKKNNKWFVVEVKQKEQYKPPPFAGHGLNIRQVKARLQIYHETGIRCIFLVFDITDGNIYTQYLDVLNKGKYFDTRNKIRVYPLEMFKNIGSME